VNNLSKILVLCSALMLAACAEDDPLKFIEEGKTLFDKGELKSAKVQFKNALQIDPRLIDASYGLALIAEEKANWKVFIRHLQDVILIDPSHVDAHVKLGYFSIKTLEKAKKYAGIALKIEPENSLAILLDGRINYEEGDYADAREKAERVLKKERNNPKAIWLQAYAMIAEKQYDQALVVIDKGLEISLANPGLLQLKVDLHKEQKKFDQVILDYKYWVERHPNDKKIRLELINALGRYGKPEQTEAAMVEAIAEYPQDIGLVLSLVKVIAAQGDLDRTETELKEFIAVLPDETRLKNRLAQLYRAKNETTKEKNILDEIVTLDPKGQYGLVAKVRLAEIALLENDRDKAEKLVSEVVLADAANTEALLFRARLRLEDKEIDEAVSDLRIVLRDKPNSDKALVMMAKAELMKNEPEVAESFWSKAIEVNPGNLKAIISLNRVLLRRGDTDRAEAILSKSVKARPSDLALHELWVKLLASQKKWVRVEAALGEMEKYVNGSPVASLLRAEIMTKRGKDDDAIKVYQSLLLEKLAVTKVLPLLAKVYAGAGQFSEGQVYFQVFIEQNPKNNFAHNELALLYMQTKQWPDAENVLNKSMQIDSASITAYKLLSAVFLRQGREGDIAELYRKGLVKIPGHPGLMLELAKRLTQDQKQSEAIALYNNLTDKYPEYDEAANNLADLLLNGSNDLVDWQRALVLAERFKESINPFYQDTYGWALFKMGDKEKARLVLSKAVEAMPENPYLRYHLGEALVATGYSLEGRVELEKAVSLFGDKLKVVEMVRTKELLRQMEGVS